jgi:hypothetical protein
MGFTVTDIGYAALTHPVLLLLTVRLPEYTPGAAAPAGTTRTMGLAGSTAFTTSVKPARFAAAS